MTRQTSINAFPSCAKRLMAILIAHAPYSALRVMLYRVILGYDIGPQCIIGYGVVIAVNSFSAGRNVVIRSGTCFTGPLEVVLAERTFFGRFNRVECGNGAASPAVQHMNYTRRFETGYNSLINEGHLFDVFGTISIGRGSWVAGFNSQFLTHGVSVMNRDITIGEECFVGSAVRFSPGSSVANRVIVGIGAVVTRQFPDSNVVVGGLPARIIKVRDESDGYHFEKNW